MYLKLARPACVLNLWDFAKCSILYYFDHSIGAVEISMIKWT